MKLETNPFYVLNLTCNDNRRTIQSAAEEMSFMLEQDVCLEAQNALLTPAKRIEAELDWFVDLDASTLDDIHRQIDIGATIAAASLDGLSRLNALVYNFSVSEFDNIFDLEDSICEIDEAYSLVDIYDVTDSLNVCRSHAKFPEAGVHEVSQVLNRKRDSIRQTIFEELGTLVETEYLKLVTALAEDYVDAVDEGQSGIILADIIDQYELKVQAELETATDSILNVINEIIDSEDKYSVQNKIPSLIVQVKNWDRLAQPLQLKAQASGMPHTLSNKLGSSLRSLAVTLHNDKGLSNEALQLVSAMKDVFAELDELNDLFENDAEQLSIIVKEKSETESLVASIDVLQNKANEIKTYTATKNQIDAFIALLRSVDDKIKFSNLDAEQKNKLRELICCLVRDVAIALHNNKNQTEFALEIAYALREEFNDLSSLAAKLKEDCTVLEQQKTLKLLNSIPKSVPRSSKRSSGLGVFIAAGVFLIILALSNCNGSSGTAKPTPTPYKPALPSPTYYVPKIPSSTKKPSQPNNSVTNSNTESKYSSSSKLGEKVYAEIVSIFPAHGIYTEGTNNYTHFLCECQTSTGSTIWVYISVAQYRINFDANISSSINNDTAYEITWNFNRKIHGKVTYSDSIINGLSSEIGNDVFEFSSLD